MNTSTNTRMKNRIALALVAVAGLTVGAHAQSIEGNWVTQSGANAKISKCGNAYCINITSGQHSGTQVGRVSGNGPKYRGTVTDPGNGKTYNGSATVSGNALKLSGCVGGVFCRSQNWSRR